MCDRCVLVEIVPDDFDCGLPLVVPANPETLTNRRIAGMARSHPVR
jgi:hypothetical protein